MRISEKKLTWEEKCVKTTNEEEGDHMEEVQKSLKHRNKRERGERKRYAKQIWKKQLVSK